jgi:hypothetical protein
MKKAGPDRTPASWLMECPAVVVGGLAGKVWERG